MASKNSKAKPAVKAPTESGDAAASQPRAARKTLSNTPLDTRITLADGSVVEGQENLPQFDAVDGKGTDAAAQERIASKVQAAHANVDPSVPRQAPEGFNDARYAKDAENITIHKEGYPDRQITRTAWDSLSEGARDGWSETSEEPAEVTNLRKA